MSNAPSSASPCVCSQSNRGGPRAVVVDGVDRVERLDVEVGVVRELVVEHRLRPEHARRVIDGDEPVELHQQVQPAQQVLARAEHAALRRRGLHQQRNLGAADGVTLAVGERRRAPADHVGVGHGRVTRGGDDRVAPRRVRQPDRPRAVEAGRHVGAARGHAPASPMRARGPGRPAARADRGSTTSPTCTTGLSRKGHMLRSSAQPAPAASWKCARLHIQSSPCPRPPSTKSSASSTSGSRSTWRRTRSAPSRSSTTRRTWSRTP